jgi:hypothetical protein
MLERRWASHSGLAIVGMQMATGLGEGGVGATSKGLLVLASR